MEEADAGGIALGGEADRLVNQYLREVEGGDVPKAERPEADGHAAGAAAGFEQGRGAVGKESLDEDALGRPETEFVRGARVVQDGRQVVEIGANLLRGNLFQGTRLRHAAMNIPFAFNSCGQSISRGSAPKSGF